MSTVRLHGGIPSGTRGALVDRFRGDPSIQVFMSGDRVEPAGRDCADQPRAALEPSGADLGMTLNNRKLLLPKVDSALSSVTPKNVRCIHPWVTCLEKLDAIARRFEQGKAAADFVRHYEDAAHILRQRSALPPLDTELPELIELIAREDNKHMPTAAHLAFHPDRSERWKFIEDAWTAIDSMFWGAPRPSPCSVCARTMRSAATAGWAAARSRERVHALGQDQSGIFGDTTVVGLDQSTHPSGSTERPSVQLKLDYTTSARSGAFKVLELPPFSGVDERTEYPRCLERGVRPPLLDRRREPTSFPVLGLRRAGPPERCPGSFVQKSLLAPEFE